MTRESPDDTKLHSRHESWYETKTNTNTKQETRHANQHMTRGSTRDTSRDMRLKLKRIQREKLDTPIKSSHEATLETPIVI